MINFYLRMINLLKLRRINWKIESKKKIAERDRIYSRVKIAWNRASPIQRDTFLANSNAMQ